MEISYINIVTGQVIKPSTYWMMQAARYNEHTTASEKEEFLAMYGVSALRVWIAMNPETQWKEQNAPVDEEHVIKPQPEISDPFLSSTQPIFEVSPVLEPQPVVIEEHLAIQPELEHPAHEPEPPVISVEEQGNDPHQKRRGMLAAISFPFGFKKGAEAVKPAEPAAAFIADEIAEPTLEASIPVQVDESGPDASVSQLHNELVEQTHAEPDRQMPPAPSLRPHNDQIIPVPPTRPKAVQAVPAPPARPRSGRENPAPPLRPKSTAAASKPVVTTPGTAVKNYSKEDLWRMAKLDPYYDETATEDNGVVIRESRFNIKLVLVVVACLVVVVGGAISIALILS